ncbi:hypothetical protein PML95_07600 [Vagococcus lutrae]|uniref:Uncharacterized protein n=1 Tax=Vagococcus lutrae TaxID=81947 RepID=A0AAE9XDS7_9ENTE|nr:hypothetical protein [Vagococcus lutrae]UQF38927.1 hypothetical protein M2904_02835 [Vagococcus lutrae]WCG22258.1 hypothetical protein PML95_07600 [Vagococcus lutrae]
MKKVSLFTVGILSLVVLGGCGNEEVTTKVSDASVESIEQVTSSQVSNDEEEEKNDKVEYNQNIIDDEYIKVSLMDITHHINKMYDEEKYVVSFDIINKREHKIVVQAREVSINDRMVDESLQTMSTEISGGKSATAKLEIEDYSGGDLPELIGNLEMILHTFDWDEFDYEYDIPVRISLK